MSSSVKNCKAVCNERATLGKVYIFVLCKIYFVQYLGFLELKELWIWKFNYYDTNNYMYFSSKLYYTYCRNHIQEEICLVSGEPGTFWDLEPEFSNEYEDEASLINQIV